MRTTPSFSWECVSLKARSNAYCCLTIHFRPQSRGWLSRITTPLRFIRCHHPYYRELPRRFLGRTEGFEPSTSESQSNVLPLHYVQHQSGAPPRIQTLIVGVEIRNAIRYTKGALNSSTSLFNSFPQISHPNVFSLANNSIFGISSPNSCTILFLISSGFLL